MTKAEALALLNCNIKELASKLGISPEAVSKWNEARIPLGREYQIRDIAAGRKPLGSSPAA